MNGIDREKAEEYFRKNPDMKRLAEETMDEWISESCRWASEGKFSFLKFRPSKGSKKRIMELIHNLAIEYPNEVIGRRGSEPKFGEEITQMMVEGLRKVITETFNEEDKRQVKKKLKTAYNSMKEGSEIVYAAMVSLNAFDNQDNPFLLSLYVRWVFDYFGVGC